MKTSNRKNQLRLALFAALEPRTLFSASSAVLLLNQPSVLPDVVISAPTQPPAPLVFTSSDVGIPVVIQLLDTATAIQVGDPITLTAIVTDSIGNVLDGQTIQLVDQNSAVVTTAQISQGVATYDWTPATGGLHTLTANLSAQPGYADSVSDPIDLNVYRRAAALQLSVTQSAGNFQLTATASSVDDLSFAPTGPVQFYDNGKLLGTVNLGATLATPLTLSSGTHALTAFYAGSGAFFSASASDMLKLAGPIVVKPIPAPPVGSVPPPSAARPLNPAWFASPTAAPIAATSPTTIPLLIETSGVKLSASSTAYLVQSQNAFGLTFADFRQFYEAHLPPELTLPLPPITPGIAVAGTADPHEGN